MSILLADACALMVSNEERTALKKIVPVVAMAISSSHAITTTRVPTALFGIFTRIDHSQVDACSRIATEMQDDLHTECAQGEQLVLGMSRNMVFRRFKGSGRPDDDQSDIRFVGSIAHGLTVDYGYVERVTSAIKHIAQSAIENPWRAHTFATYLRWIEVVSKVAASNNRMASVESVAAASNK
jgi:hypothetical protein